MKKILILTASTGEGHNQAAKTLESEFRQNGYQCKRVDMFKSTHRSMDILMSDGYKVLASNMPKMYGTLYRKADDERFNRLFVRKVLKVTEHKVKRIAQEFGADVIIATHPFAVPMIGHLKQHHKLNIPFIQVVTDFRAHYAYVDPYVDAYITASEHAMHDLVKRGISKSKIHPYGIPVKREFLERLQRIDKAQKPFTLLIMGGSMGMKAMEKVVDQVAANKNDILMQVVCGKNKSLKNTLERKFKTEIGRGNLQVHGFVNNIPELMESSDVIITKPGGLTSSEAINKTIPMLIPFAIPGQEQENTDLLVASGMAIDLKTVDEINVHINAFIENPDECKKMAMNMASFAQGFSIFKIVELVDRLTNPVVSGIEGLRADYSKHATFRHVQ